jgi:hypothetical protein
VAHPAQVRHNPHALLSRRTEALSSGGAQSDKEADPEVQAANAEVGVSGNPRDTSLAAINSLMEPSFSHSVQTESGCTSCRSTDVALVADPLCCAW